MTHRVERGDGWELHLGKWQDVLADVECDAVITDPPYSERTHSGMRIGDVVNGSGNSKTREGVIFNSWTPDDARAYAIWAHSAAKSWVVTIEDHMLCAAILSELDALGRYTFPPLPAVELGKQPRLGGDGPASWSTFVGVARPRQRRFQSWGSLPGAYVVAASGNQSNGRIVKGGKTMQFMRAIVRDYSRPGDLVCDPCAGGGTTLLAAVTEGRRAIGAECDPATFELAVKRLRKGHTRSLFTEAPRVAPAETGDLFGGDS